MDVYADRWKALKRTTNQKVSGSNPDGRAIYNSDKTGVSGLFCFCPNENQRVYWAKLGKLTVWPVQFIVQMYDCLL